MTYEELKKLGYDNLNSAGLRIRGRKLSKKDLPGFDFSSGIKTSKGIMYPPEFLKKVEEYFSEPTKEELHNMGMFNFTEIGNSIGKPNLDIRTVPKELLSVGLKTRVGIYFTEEQVKAIKDYVLNLTKTEKYTKTVNEKYGVDNVSQLEEIKKKKIETTIAHYGTAYSFSLPSTKKTIMEKYGVDNVSKLDFIKEKKKNTCLKNYGVVSGLKTEKCKQAVMEKYGVENVSQVPEIQKKKMEGMAKKFVFNKVVFDSSWEMAYYFHLQRNHINFEFHPNEFLEYKFNGIKHRYFPDFKINGKYVEIKGDYWYSLMLEENTVNNAKLKCMEDNNVKILLEKDMVEYIKEFERYNGNCYQYRKKRNLYDIRRT